MEMKCPVCGAPLDEGKCSYCGYADKKEMPNDEAFTSLYRQVGNEQQVISNSAVLDDMDIIPGVSKKNKTVALLLCIFLGVFGVHRFYVGKVGTGILYLLTGGFLGLGWIIDIVLIATGSFKDEFGLPLQ